MNVSNFKYFIGHDGEFDDIAALAIASEALPKDASVYVDTSIGNPLIVHSPAKPEMEMEERINLTNLIFDRNVAYAGTTNNETISQGYVNNILNSKERIIVLHTASFSSLNEIFKQAKQGQLQDAVFLTYGSVNMTWALKSPEAYEAFYQNLGRSGAKLIQVEAYPFLDTKNKITAKNTPITFSVMQSLDGVAGKKIVDVNLRAIKEILAKQVGKVLDYIFEGKSKANVEQLEQIESSLVKLVSLFSGTNTDDKRTLQTLFTQTIDPVRHDELVKEFKKLVALLPGITGANADDLKRPFNIMESMTLRGQALIADQIPAILFAELVEKRNGLMKECLPVRLDKFEGKFAQYIIDSTQRSLYILNTEMNIKRSFTDISKEELKEKVAAKHAEYLKYIDLVMTLSILGNKHLVTPETRVKLLTEDFSKKIAALSNEVASLGYDIPNALIN